LGVLVDPNDRADVLRGIRDALGRPKGQVSPLLSEYSEDKFVRRVHGILDAVTRGALAEG
jgi:hypothetical protein